MDIKDKYTVFVNSLEYNNIDVEGIKNFFYELQIGEKLFCPEFYFFPGLRVAFDIRKFDEIVNKVKLSNQTSAFQIYCSDNINFGVRLEEKRRAYKASLNLFIPAFHLKDEQTGIKPRVLLLLFMRMISTLRQPYGYVTPLSNRELFREIRRIVDTEKVPESTYWLHYFNQTQVGVIGHGRLKGAPCHNVIKTPQGGMLLVMLEEFFDQERPEHLVLQAELNDYLELSALHQQYPKVKSKK